MMFMGGGSGTAAANRRFSTGFARRSSVAVGVGGGIGGMRQAAQRRQSVAAGRRPSTPNQLLAAKARQQAANSVVSVLKNTARKVYKQHYVSVICSLLDMK